MAKEWGGVQCQLQVRETELGRRGKVVKAEPTYTDSWRWKGKWGGEERGRWGGGGGSRVVGSLKEVI